MAELHAKDVSPEEAERTKRSNRLQIAGLALVVGMFGGVPLYELARYFF